VGYSLNMLDNHFPLFYPKREVDVFWKFLTDLASGQHPTLSYELVHYD